MLNRFTNSLKRLIGRIKIIMSDWFLSYGNLLVPTGLVIEIFTLDRLKGTQAYIGFIIGVIAIIIGVFTLAIAWRVLKKEQADRDMQFIALLKEIKEFRQDMKKAINERDNNTKDTDDNL